MFCDLLHMLREGLLALLLDRGEMAMHAVAVEVVSAACCHRSSADAAMHCCRVSCCLHYVIWLQILPDVS
jgi:hypothetical protein